MASEKRAVTQEDLDNDPKLVEDGVKVGDEHEFEAKEETPAEGGADGAGSGVRAGLL